MNNRILIWTLFAAMYLAGGLWLHGHALDDENSIWSRYDEKFAHFPEVQRLVKGGAIASNHSHVALAPGMHSLYATALNAGGNNADSIPWALQLFNLLLALVVAATAVAWLTATAPKVPEWQRDVLAGLLLLSPYTVASGLWLTSDNFGMALFFATGAALTNASSPARIGLSAALAGLTVLIRHIYMPALITLPAWALISKQPLRGALAASFVAAVCFSPFALVWHGLTPKNFAGVHETRLFTANILTLCVFVTYLSALMSPLLDWQRLRNAIVQPLSLNLALLGSMVAFAACLWDASSFIHNPLRYQDGALLYLLQAKLQPLGSVAWVLLSYALVIAGGLFLGILASLMWEDPAKRLAIGLIGLHLAALCFQERPYQRYFEGPVILLFFIGLSSWMRTRWTWATPLLLIWLLQIGIYLKRLL